MTSGGNNFNYFAENQLTKVLKMREISVTRNFQGYFSSTFQDQSDFPGLSRSWKFKEKNPGLSRIFQEAWNPADSFN